VSETTPETTTDPTSDTKLNRSHLGVRVSYVMTSVGCFFVTLVALGTWPEISQPEVWSTLQWVLGGIGVAVAGDTYRPSGQKASASA
jgi:hypothetical protein